MPWNTAQLGRINLFAWLNRFTLKCYFSIRTKQCKCWLIWLAGHSDTSLRQVSVVQLPATPWTPGERYLKGNSRFSFVWRLIQNQPKPGQKLYQNFSSIYFATNTFSMLFVPVIQESIVIYFLVVMILMKAYVMLATLIPAVQRYIFSLPVFFSFLRKLDKLFLLSVKWYPEVSLWLCWESFKGHISNST